MCVCYQLSDQHADMVYRVGALFRWSRQAAVSLHQDLGVGGLDLGTRLTHKGCKPRGYRAFPRAFASEDLSSQDLGTRAGTICVYVCVLVDLLLS